MPGYSIRNFALENYFNICAVVIKKSKVLVLFCHKTKDPDRYKKISSKLKKNVDIISNNREEK